MTNYRPPINARTTEELIAIKHGTTDLWQQEAIDQATQELEERSVSFEDEHLSVTKLKRQAKLLETRTQKRWLNNQYESYTRFEMVEIFLLSPLILLGKWDAGIPFWLLRDNNYHRKFKQRLCLLTAGLLMWVLLIWISLELLPASIS